MKRQQQSERELHVHTAFAITVEIDNETIIHKPQGSIVF